MAGFIFYPGGKVGYTAYAPLMLALAEQDILCVLLEMPFNLAVLDSSAAEGRAFRKSTAGILGGIHSVAVWLQVMLRNIQKIMPDLCSWQHILRQK